MSTRRERQTLIFDADDTLWENNILFVRVIEDYLDWVAHPTLSRTEIKRLLLDIEVANIATRGYGSAAFLDNLAECLERLRERPASEAERRHLDVLAAELLRHEVVLMPDVAGTLAALGRRHRLLLLTKGAPDEQQRKIDASGLVDHFAAVHIVAEKTPAVYTRLVAQHALAPEATWMIGNSPRSDIIAARAAGLNAVFIPHHATWELEQAELDPDDASVLVLSGIGELLHHF